MNIELHDIADRMSCQAMYDLAKQEYQSLSAKHAHQMYITPYAGNMYDNRMLFNPQMERTQPCTIPVYDGSKIYADHTGVQQVRFMEQTRTKSKQQNDLKMHQYKQCR